MAAAQLRSDLHHAIRHNCNGMLCLPQQQFAELFVQDRISKVLNDSALTQWVCDHARKIFAIHLMIDTTMKHMPNCMEQNFVDKDLPVSLNSQLVKNALGDGLVHMFQTHQWLFLSPVLTQDISADQIPVWNLQAETPLPFESMSCHKPARYPGFVNYSSAIYKCKVFPGHLHSFEVSILSLLALLFIVY